MGLEVFLLYTTRTFRWVLIWPCFQVWIIVILVRHWDIFQGIIGSVLGVQMHSERSLWRKEECSGRILCWLFLSENPENNLGLKLQCPMDPSQGGGSLRWKAGCTGSWLYHSSFRPLALKHFCTSSSCVSLSHLGNLSVPSFPMW